MRLAGLLFLSAAADAFLAPSGTPWTRTGRIGAKSSCGVARTAMGPFDFLPNFGQGAGLRGPGKLRKVKFGELQVSEMGLGTWSWGNQLLWGYEGEQDAELQEVFNLAVDSGVNLFDTGDSYGTGRLNGQSEKLLGRFMKEYAEKNGGTYPYIGTKFASYPWRLTAGSLERACEESASRLQRPVDVGQMHWSVANYAPWQERALWQGLANMYKSGQARGQPSPHRPPQLHPHTAGAGRCGRSGCPTSGRSSCARCTPPPPHPSY